jgi:hypothetical protein
MAGNKWLNGIETIAHLPLCPCSIYNENIRRGCPMKKTKHYLTEAEWRYLLHSLNALKTKLHSEGRYTDTVDEVMLKLMTAPVKKVKVS